MISEAPTKIETVKTEFGPEPTGMSFHRHGERCFYCHKSIGAEEDALAWQGTPCTALPESLRNTENSGDVHDHDRYQWSHLLLHLDCFYALTVRMLKDAQDLEARLTGIDPTSLEARSRLHDTCQHLELEVQEYFDPLRDKTGRSVGARFNSRV